MTMIEAATAAKPIDPAELRAEGPRPIQMNVWPQSGSALFI